MISEQVSVGSEGSEDAPRSDLQTKMFDHEREDTMEGVEILGFIIFRSKCVNCGYRFRYFSNSSTSGFDTI